MLATLSYCIVGCNAGAPDKQALHVLECDTETGAARIVQSVTGLQGTTYFAIDAERKNLYTMVSEEGKGALVRFALDGHTIGAMTKLVDLPCGAPCHIALSPDGKTLGFAAYSSGTCGVFDLEEAGTPPRIRTVASENTSPQLRTVASENAPSRLGTVASENASSRLKTYVLPNDAMGPNEKRQKKAYAHQVFFLDPNGVGPKNTMGVVDLGCDRIVFFDRTTLERRADLAIAAEPGDGPRHSIIPAGSGNKVIYTLNELSSSVTARAFDGTAFRTLGRYTMTPQDLGSREANGESPGTKAAAIKLTADGKILMASNRGHESIAFYETSPTGTLALKNIAKLTGSFPRDFELMPGEKFMVVGHKMSNEIQIYAFDRGTCTLTPVGDAIAAWRPLCFKFL